MEIREAIERSMSEKRQVFGGSAKRFMPRDVTWLIKENILYSVDFTWPGKTLVQAISPSNKFQVSMVYTD